MTSRGARRSLPSCYRSELALWGGAPPVLIHSKPFNYFFLNAVKGVYLYLEGIAFQASYAEWCQGDSHCLL